MEQWIGQKLLNAHHRKWLWAREGTSCCRFRWNMLETADAEESVQKLRSFFPHVRISFIWLIENRDGRLHGYPLKCRSWEIKLFYISQYTHPLRYYTITSVTRNDGRSFIQLIANHWCIYISFVKGYENGKQPTSHDKTPPKPYTRS